MDTFCMNNIHVNHTECIHYISYTIIFDGLKTLHHYGENENKILYISSLLHESGKNLSYCNDFLHTFYIIKNTNLYSLSHREIVITAAVAASYRKNSLLNHWHKEFQNILVDSDKKIYQTLSLFLKLAYCFDRSHTSIIDDLEFLLKENIVKIKTICNGEPELELSMASELSDEFFKLFNKKLIIT